MLVGVLISDKFVVWLILCFNRRYSKITPVAKLKQSPMSDVGNKDQITKPSFDEELERLSKHFDDERFPNYREIKIADVSEKESDFENQELPSRRLINSVFQPSLQAKPKN